MSDALYRALRDSAEKTIALRQYFARSCNGGGLHCNEPECSWCGILACPHGEPLHYHHDGCPACYGDMVKEQEQEHKA